MEITPGYYKHYKGTMYWVLGIFTHTETNEKLVGYSIGNQYYVRPLAMFLETINGKPRFEKCSI